MNNPRTNGRRRLGPTDPRRTPAAPTAPSHTTNVQAADLPTVDPSVDDDDLYLSSLPVIDDVTGQVCRRHHLSATEADDFRSDVRAHFYDRHCEALRRFEGRSSLATYLTVAIQRLFLDYRNRTWGRWRPSAEAKRLGPTAMLLERLIVRDGWSATEAAELLRVNHGIAFDPQLQALSDRLTKRPSVRQFVPEVELLDLESPAPGSDAIVVRRDQDILAHRVRLALTHARQTLETEEQLIVKLHFEDAVSVASISRALHLDQKRLYRTIERVLARLGECLDAEGISREDVRDLFAAGVLDWSGDTGFEHDEEDGTEPHDARDGTGQADPGPRRYPRGIARGPWQKQ